MIQKHASSKTSINSVSAVYTQNLDKFVPGSTILDYGGGRFDTNAEYMWKKRRVKVLVYDPYNRSPEHNEIVLMQVSARHPDYIVCSNVLNVIDDDAIINSIIEDIRRYADPTTAVMFKIYEGNRSRIGKETKGGESWQRNQPTEDYIPYIQKHFPDAQKKRGFITVNMNRRSRYRFRFLQTLNILPNSLITLDSSW